VFLFEHEESFQAGVALMITELSLILSIWVQPYEVQIVSTMESLSLITTFCTFIACLLISHEPVATSTDMVVAFVTVGVNLGFAVVMTLLFLKDSSTTLVRKVQDNFVVQRVRDSEVVQRVKDSKISQEFTSFRQRRRMKSQVEVVETMRRATSKPTGDLYPVVPKHRPSDTDSRKADNDQVPQTLVLESTDSSEDEATVGEVRSVDFEDSGTEDSGTEEVRPHDEVRTMMLAKDDEIQGLKLQLHTLQRYSRRIGRTSEPSDTATAVPLDGAQMVSEPAPPASVSRIEDGPSNGNHHRDRVPLPVVPAASEESRFINRELRHGRLTDHVKSSANRGDLESFIAAT
jgi:hypothetical protein